MRVAIIGLGPKGMFALERLLDHAARMEPQAPIEIDAFEPHPTPGAGPNYDPRQPPYLRMNFAAAALDMWWPASAAVPADERRSFVAWSEDQGEACAGESYPARATVGRYLGAGLRTLLAHAPPNVRVELHPTRVRGLRFEHPRWEVVGADGSRGRYDEVLIATGHEPSWSGSLAGTPRAPVIAGVFPMLSRDRIAPAATVAARGFALTFIDASLALTEGRGGSFEAAGRHPYRVRYASGPDDVAVILPFARRGRPMLAKPAAEVAASIPGIEEIGARGRARILGLADGFALERDLVPVLTAAARGMLRAAGAPTAEIGAWLTAAVAGAAVAAAEPPAQELERSLAVGAGLRAPGIQWALGQTWRALYPALVGRLSGDGLAAAHWPGFRRLAAEMERLAFGPPAINAAKLLALIEAGRVDLAFLNGARLGIEAGRPVLRAGRRVQAVDVVLDAVIPPPGAADGGGENLLGSLIAAGHASIAPGRRGIDVNADASCRRADGTPSIGLAAIGRPTEDSVIGNDTLNRSLHPQADVWAQRVVAGAATAALAAPRRLR